MAELSSVKKNFIFGLVSGVAFSAVAALVVVLVVFAGGSSAKPSVFENNPTNPNAGSLDNAAVAGAPVDVKVGPDDHIRGNLDAPITIVEFSDLQCPFCSRFHETLQQVMKNYSGQVRWVYKHFPLVSIHPYAFGAAEASECAAEQGKFWEYTDAIFANQSKLNADYISKAAEDIGLNMNQFDSCYTSHKYKQKVSDDYNAGAAAGVRGTPGNFINGQSVPGAVPYEQVQAIIESLL